MSLAATPLKTCPILLNNYLNPRHELLKSSGAREGARIGYEAKRRKKNKRRKKRKPEGKGEKEWKTRENGPGRKRYEAKILENR